eukprot:TRINITY_DN4899_c0_g1_i1.p1 TRINITY_DN4899_c0_g1~~TRINITY_DN4899_c0_g1_i1.p1  ORF type:complete len:395 (+),score=111.21 TRINITY_DN4899_c0_g1_i1:98-1282(+)
MATGIDGPKQRQKRDDDKPGVGSASARDSGFHLLQVDSDPGDADMWADSGPEPWLDLVTVVAGYMVAVGHCITFFRFGRINFGPAAEDVNALAVLVRPGISLLFLMSGYKWLARSDPPGAFLRARAARLVPPLLFWTLLTNAMMAFFGELTWPEAARSALVGMNPYNAWLLYAMLFCYVATPVLQVCMQKLAADSRALLHLLLLWFVASPLQTTALLRFKLTAWPTALSYVDFPYNYGALYLAGGAVARLWPELSRRQLAAAGLVYAAASALVLVDSELRRLDLGSVLELWDAPHCAFFVLQAVVLFALIRALGQKSIVADNRLLCRLLRTLADHGTGIYLVHVQFLQLLVKLRLVYTTGINVEIPVLAAALCVASWCVVVLCRRIPYLRRVTL